jgi:hypothetical protein
MRLTCIVKAVLLSIAFSLGHAQSSEQKTYISFRHASGDTTIISRRDSAGVQFISLNDFLKSLHLSVFINDSTRKLESLIANQFVRFTDRNPFVVITERTTNTSVIYQMSGSVVRRNGDYFVSAASFIPL